MADRPLQRGDLVKRASGTKGTVTHASEYGWIVVCDDMPSGDDEWDGPGFSSGSTPGDTPERAGWVLDEPPIESGYGTLTGRTGPAWPVPKGTLGRPPTRAIEAIKLIRQLRSWSLKEAKEAYEALPTPVPLGLVTVEQVRLLREIGCTVEVTPHEPSPSERLNWLADGLHKALKAVRLGGATWRWDDGVVLILREVVRPAESMEPRDTLYAMLGARIAWKDAGAFVDAIGEAIGEAMLQEFHGERAPAHVALGLELPGERVAEQLRYNASLLGDRLRDALYTALTDPKAEFRAPKDAG